MNLSTIMRAAETGAETTAETSADSLASSVAGIDWSVLLQNFVNGCVSIAWKLIVSLIVFVIGRALIRFLLKHFPDGKRFDAMDPTAKNFIRNCISAILWIVLVITIVGIMGIQMASVVTVLASAGAAVALALQGSLSNFAGGVMILIFKPFHLNDYIEVGGNAGTVIDLGIFYTTLRTGDNRRIIIPNGSLTSTSLVNASLEKTRRVDIVFTAAYGTDTELVKSTALEVAAKHEKIMQEPKPFIRMSEMADSSLNFTMRVWCEAGDYWTVKFDLLEEMNRVFAEKGIEVPFPQIDVHVRSED